jgi:hypothetical protein
VPKTRNQLSNRFGRLRFAVSGPAWRATGWRASLSPRPSRSSGAQPACDTRHRRMKSVWARLWASYKPGRRQRREGSSRRMAEWWSHAAIRNGSLAGGSLAKPAAGVAAAAYGLSGRGACITSSPRPSSSSPRPRGSKVKSRVIVASFPQLISCWPACCLFPKPRASGQRHTVPCLSLV